MAKSQPVLINNSRDMLNGNLGDAVSRHELYFSWLSGAPRADLTRVALMGDPRIKKRGFILGGGGLFDSLNLFQLGIERITSQLEDSTPSVFWSAGVNHHITDGDMNRPKQLQGLEKFSLVGIRDYMPDSDFSWVPCSSVLLPELQKNYLITRPVVVYNNWQFRVKDVPSNIPTIDNNRRFHMATSKRRAVTEVIEFLGSAETVVTSAYHGALWATLLGRRVVVVSPFSTKFRYFRHMPGIVKRDTPWRVMVDSAIRYPGILPLYRQASLDFAEEVKTLFNLK